MVTRTTDHKYFWRLWSVQLSALSAGLATTVGVAAMANMPKPVVVSIAGAILVVNFLQAYTRTVVQSGLLEPSHAEEVREDPGLAGGAGQESEGS